MEQNVVISDLTLSTTERVGEAKCFRREHVYPCEKVELFAKKFDCFLMYNPEYVQEGTIQIAVSAAQDVGAYQIGPSEYIEDVLVSKTPIRGAKYFVAKLGETRNCASSYYRFKRCLYANTFYLHVDDKGVVHLDKLLGNNDWLHARRVDHALKIVVERLKGKMSEEKLQWTYFSYGEIKDFGRVGHYVTADDQKRLIVCMLNSGTILPNIDPSDIKLLGVTKKEGCPYMVTPLLRFRMLSDNVVARVSADSVNTVL